MKTKTNKNPFITAILVIATSVFIFAAAPRPSYAQFGIPQTSFTLGDIPRKLGEIWENIKKKTGSRAFQQAIRSVSYKLAQDTALWISTGGKGKKPLIFEDFGKFARETGDVVAGKYLVNLSQGWPVDLCSPSNIRSKLAITVGLPNILKDLEFRAGKVNKDLGAEGCKLTTMGKNFAQEAKKSNFLVKFSQDFTGVKSDLGIAAQLQEDIKKKEEQFSQEELVKRIQKGDLKSVNNYLTQFPETTKEQVEEATKEAQRRAAEKPPRTEDIFLDTLAVFANTLAKSYMAKLQSGYFPFRKTRAPDSPLSDVAGADVSDKALLASFSAFSPERALQLGSSGEVDLFADMVSCPPGQYQSPYNCLLSDGLSQAVQQKLTVKQALERKALNPDMIFPEEHEPEQAKLSLLNLRKLRFLRVLPLGWEIAAEKLEGKRPVTLKTVVDCFDKSATAPECDIDGDGQNELKGLIDPDWVLALPQQYCRAQGWIGVTAHESSPNRAQACVDLQSCVKQDPNGRCEGFGYCARERQLWQISGQQCDAQYATCQNFTRPNGTALSILGSSVNNVGCREDSAGCSWYSQTLNPDPSGTGADTWISDAANSRVYLNSQAQTCRAEDAGSREIIPLEPGANLIRNSGFDPEFAGVSMSDNNWGITSNASILNDGQPGSGQISQTIQINRHAYYTFSFFVNPVSGATADVTVNIAAPSGALLYKGSFAAGANESASLNLTIPAANITGGLSRWAGTFYNRNATAVTVTLSGNVVFDNAQLEEIGVQQGKRAEEAVAASADKSVDVLNSSPPGSVNVASPATSYKDYKDNRRLVFAGAGECTADDATARAYTSTLSQVTEIARLTPDGLCPKECGGLTSFLAMPTFMDERSAQSEYKTPQVRSFVPTYGKVCSASEVGCEEFTNITQKGAEKRQYFSQIRACVAEGNPKAATFYTWEGKEQAGFQLKVWKLLKDENGANGKGPCATFRQGAGQDPVAAACQDTGGGSAECDIYDDNCRVFLDEGGTQYPRDITDVVSVSSECAAFRRTKLVAGTAEQEVWHFIPSEARSCGAAAVACREYKGARANVVTNLLFSNFESGLDNWTGGALSTETAVAKSVIAGSQSFSFNGTASRDIGEALSGYSGNMLLLKFLAKANGASATINGALYQSAGTTLIASFSNTAVGLTGDWRSYTLGPIPLNSNIDSAVIKITGSGAVFIDNITLLASPDRLYLITDSWKDKQPSACSATASDGTPLLTQCNAYTDKKSNTFFVSGFEALFPEQAQYCEAVIDTQNSESPFSQSFNAANDGGSDPNKTFDNIIVPADLFMYRYIQAANLRNKDAAGCTALGAPRLDNSNNPTGWDATYRKLEPDNFGSTLCLAEAVGCQAFKEEGGGTKVFRDPGKKLCAWDSEANDFIKLKEDGTPSTATVTDGSVRPEECPTDYARTCPSDQGGCTAYAPTNPNLREGVSTALFVQKDTVDPGNCAGGEDIGLGCVNFKEGFSDAGSLPPILQDKLSSSRERALKVDARRECAEWLAPTTTSEVSDPASRSVRTVVYDLGRCQKLGANGSCVKWTKPGDTLYPTAYGSGAALSVLNANNYQNRLAGKTLFSGAWDYSGYSIPNQYPPEKLAENIDVNPPVLSSGDSDTPSALACRSYPEEDSPFDSSRLAVDSNGKFIYNDDTRHLQNVNKFESGEQSSCSYKKVVSQSEGNKYFSITTNNTFPEDTQSVTDLTGWSGYCLQYDNDTRDPATNQPICLAWWPVDVPQAGVNIFENHPEAGFSSSGPLYYCLEAKGNKISNDTLQYVNSKDSTYLVTVANTKDDAKKGIITDNGYPSRFKAFLNNFYVATSTVSTISLDAGTAQIINETKIDGNTLITPLAPPKPDEKVTDWSNVLVGYALGGPIGGIIGGLFGKDKVVWEDVGTKEGSGIMQYRVRNQVMGTVPISPLAGLHEYDIEAIILTARTAEHAAQWPANGEQLILNRDGFAYSPVEDITTKDRWTALWCGGADGAKCKFGGEYSWDKFLPAIENISCNPGSSETIDSSHNTNLLAIRARFADENGNPGNFESSDEENFEPYQFLGLEGGLCDNTGKSGWTDLQVTFQLREWCTAVAQVHQPGNTESNKAWTGRIANKSITNFPADGEDKAKTYDADSKDEILGKGVFSPNGYKQNQDSKPFGAIVPPSTTLYTPEQWDSRKDFTEEEVAQNGQMSTIKKLLEPDKQPLYVEALKGTGQIRAGSPYYCGGTTGSADITCFIPPVKDAKSRIQPIVPSIDEAVLLLKQIFAKVYRVWEWAATTAGYASSSWNELIKGGQNNDLSVAVGQCPIIQAATVSGDNKLVPASDSNICSTTGSLFCNKASRGNCGFDDATYAGRYSINGEPINNTNIIPKESKVNEEVSLQFYAYNENGEQLPLKKIEIDWDDGTITRADGNYKNHRGICNNNSNNYGETDRACENTPFQFKHVYQRAGEYTPIVKVTDNWGKFTRAFYSGAPDVIKVDNEGRWSTRNSESRGLQITNDPSQSISLAFNGSLNTLLQAKLSVTGAKGAVKYTLTTQPKADWISIGPADGQLQGLHNDENQNGNYTLLITATDNNLTPDDESDDQSDEIILSLTAEPKITANVSTNGWLVTYRNKGGKMNYTKFVEDPNLTLVATREEKENIDLNRHGGSHTMENHLLKHVKAGVGTKDGWKIENYTIAWEGKLNINRQQAGMYNFEIGCDDGCELLIDGTRVIENQGAHDWKNAGGSRNLTQGDHNIKVLYYNNQDEGEIVLKWAKLGDSLSVLPWDRISHTPPLAPTISISVAQTSIAYNTATTISWSSENANTCSVSPGGWTGTSGDKKSTGNLTNNTTYILTCSNTAGKSTTDQVAVTVGPAPIVFSEINSPNIYITVDDNYELYFNGQKIGETTDGGWQRAEGYSLSLVNGKNTFAIKGDGGGACAGLLVYSHIDGQTTILSSTSWKYALTPSVNWTSIDFNDHDWDAAQPSAIFYNDIQNFPNSSGAVGIWSSKSGPKRADGACGLNTEGDLDKYVYFRYSFNYNNPASHPVQEAPRDGAWATINATIPSTQQSVSGIPGGNASITIPYNSAVDIRWLAGNTQYCEVQKNGVVWEIPMAVSQSTGNLKDTTVYSIVCRSSFGVEPVVIKERNKLTVNVSNL